MAAPSHFVDTKKEPTGANGKGEKPGKPARITLGVVRGNPYLLPPPAKAGMDLSPNILPPCWVVHAPLVGRCCLVHVGPPC